jgi:hypothetical protein
MEKKEDSGDFEIKAPLQGVTSLSTSNEKEEEEEPQKVDLIQSSGSRDKDETAKLVVIADVAPESSSTNSKPVRQENSLANRQTKHLASGTLLHTYIQI